MSTTTFYGKHTSQSVLKSFLQYWWHIPVYFDDSNSDRLKFCPDRCCVIDLSNTSRVRARWLQIVLASIHLNLPGIKAAVQCFQILENGKTFIHSPIYSAWTLRKSVNLWWMKIALSENFQKRHFGAICTMLYLVKTEGVFLFLAGTVNFFLVYLVKFYFTGTSLTKRRAKYSIVTSLESLFWGRFILRKSLGIFFSILKLFCCHELNNEDWIRMSEKSLDRIPWRGCRFLKPVWYHIRYRMYYLFSAGDLIFCSE